MPQMNVWLRMTASTMERKGAKTQRVYRVSGYQLGRRKKAEHQALPSRITTRVGARVALQRCSIFRAGRDKYTMT